MFLIVGLINGEIRSYNIHPLLKEKYIEYSPPVR